MHTFAALHLTLKSSPCCPIAPCISSSITDQVIPVEDAHAFAACIRQHELYLVEGADHCFRAPQHAEALVKKVVAYVTAGLQ